MGKRLSHADRLERLREFDPQLANYYASGVALVEREPDLGAIRMRQVAERLARLLYHRAARGRTDTPQVTKLGFRHYVEYLTNRIIISREQSRLFNQLRKVGNDALHSGRIDSSSHTPYYRTPQWARTLLDGVALSHTTGEPPVALRRWSPTDDGSRRGPRPRFTSALRFDRLLPFYAGQVAALAGPEPDLAVIRARQFVERLVEVVYEWYGPHEYDRGDEFWNPRDEDAAADRGPGEKEMEDYLRADGTFEGEVLAYLDLIKRFGNQAAHAIRPIRRRESADVRRAVIGIARWVGANPQFADWVRTRVPTVARRTGLTGGQVSQLLSEVGEIPCRRAAARLRRYLGGLRFRPHRSDAERMERARRELSKAVARVSRLSIRQARELAAPWHEWCGACCRPMEPGALVTLLTAMRFPLALPESDLLGAARIELEQQLRGWVRPAWEKYVSARWYHYQQSVNRQVLDYARLDALRGHLFDPPSGRAARVLDHLPLGSVAQVIDALDAACRAALPEAITWSEWAQFLRDWDARVVDTGLGQPTSDSVSWLALALRFDADATDARRRAVVNELLDREFTRCWVHRWSAEVPAAVQRNGEEWFLASRRKSRWRRTTRVQRTTFIARVHQHLSPAVPPATVPLAEWPAHIEGVVGPLLAVIRQEEEQWLRRWVSGLWPAVRHGTREAWDETRTDVRCWWQNLTPWGFLETAWGLAKLAFGCAVLVVTLPLMYFLIVNLVKGYWEIAVFIKDRL